MTVGICQFPPYYTVAAARNAYQCYTLTLRLISTQFFSLRAAKPAEECGATVGGDVTLMTHASAGNRDETKRRSEILFGPVMKWTSKSLSPR
ncbi:hypothetical protein E2C01_032446 [Portunus trituberculatus]|uniref:Uncharacterized protein n=1 Tax=Portunus trituberculatus TaxID=210409 RepID=A0A5B7F0Y7_PORTR|nr:hypothetical protein [Portunus trituberculatus]